MTRVKLRPQVVIPSPLGLPINGQSMAGNITSAPTIIDGMYAISYGINWSGTSPVGTLSVQASSDFSLYPNGAVNNPGTWATMPLGLGGSAVTTIPVSGNVDGGIIDIISTGIWAIRLIYTFTSGVGTLNAIVSGKVS